MLYLSLTISTIIAHQLPVQICIIIIADKLVQGEVTASRFRVLLDKRYTSQMSMALLLIQ